MNPQLPFDSIESAQDFVTLFTEVALATKRDIEAEIQQETNTNSPRRLHALKIILDKLATLDLHLKRSARIFNDLRSLRRLVLGEQTYGCVAVRQESMETAKAETSALRPSPRLGAPGVSKTTVARAVSSCLRIRKRALSSGRLPDLRNPGAASAVPWYTRPDFNRSWGRMN
jgi:hypothetical protein